MSLKRGTGGKEQSRELEMKLLIGLRSKVGFVPIFHFPFPCARSPLHVPRFSNILLNTISQLDRVLCFVKK